MKLIGYLKLGVFLLGTWMALAGGSSTEEAPTNLSETYSSASVPLTFIRRLNEYLPSFCQVTQVSTPVDFESPISAQPVNETPSEVVKIEQLSPLPTAGNGGWSFALSQFHTKFIEMVKATLPKPTDLEFPSRPVSLTVVGYHPEDMIMFIVVFSLFIPYMLVALYKMGRSKVHRWIILPFIGHASEHSFRGREDLHDRHLTLLTTQSADGHSYIRVHLCNFLRRILFVLLLVLMSRTFMVYYKVDSYVLSEFFGRFKIGSYVIMAWTMLTMIIDVYSDIFPWIPATKMMISTPVGDSHSVELGSLTAPKDNPYYFAKVTVGVTGEYETIETFPQVYKRWYATLISFNEVFTPMLVVVQSLFACYFTGVLWARPESFVRLIPGNKHYDDVISNGPSYLCVILWGPLAIMVLNLLLRGKLDRWDWDFNHLYTNEDALLFPYHENEHFYSVNPFGWKQKAPDGGKWYVWTVFLCLYMIVSFTLLGGKDFAFPTDRATIFTLVMFFSFYFVLRLFWPQIFHLINRWIFRGWSLFKLHNLLLGPATLPLSSRDLTGLNSEKDFKEIKPISANEEELKSLKLIDKDLEYLNGNYNNLIHLRLSALIKFTKCKPYELFLLFNDERFQKHYIQKNFSFEQDKLLQDRFSLSLRRNKPDAIIRGIVVEEKIARIMYPFYCSDEQMYEGPDPVYQLKEFIRELDTCYNFKKDKFKNFIQEKLEREKKIKTNEVFSLPELNEVMPGKGQEYQKHFPYFWKTNETGNCCSPSATGDTLPLLLEYLDLEKNNNPSIQAITTTTTAADDDDATNNNNGDDIEVVE